MTRNLAGALVILAVAGCGSSDSGGSTPSELDRFLGTWTITDGMLKAMCAGLQFPISTALMGEQTVQKGADADLAFNVQPKCRLLLDASGDTAIVRPNQMCVVMASGAEVPGTVKSGTLMVSGETASFEVSGEATLPTGACNFTAMGASMRTAKP
jgi:hypothetical protein